MAVVVKRKNRWVVDLRIGGRRKRLAFETRQSAEDYRREALLRREGLRKPLALPKAVPITLVDAINRYASVVSVKKESCELERRYFEKLNCYMKTCSIEYLSEVGTMELMSFQQSLASSISEKTGAKLSAATVNRHFNSYRSFFSTMVDWELIERNPIAKVPNLVETPATRKLWTVDEMRTVFESAPRWLGDYLFVMSQIPVRNCELNRLKWKDVDLETKRLRLISFKGRNGNARVTEKELTPALNEFLHSHYQTAVRLNRSKPDDYVLASARGGKLTTGRVCRALKLVFKKPHIERLNLTSYGLRHTILTDLSNAGVSADVLQKLAGHSSFATTQRYLHTGVKQQREALLLSPAANQLVRNPLHAVTIGHQKAL